MVNANKVAKNGLLANLLPCFFAGDLFFTVPGAVYKLPAGAGPDAAVRIAGNPFTALAFTEVAGPALSMGLNPLGLTVNPDNNEELWLIDNDSVVLCCGSSLC